MDAWLAWTVALVLAYFGLLTWSLTRRGPGLQGPWFFFLRAFFPNWKFFHAVGRAPRLYVRAQTGPQAWSDWQLVYPRQPRRMTHLLHNPVVNLALSQQNLVDHLAQDINELPEGADLSQCVSFELVRRLAQDAVRGGCWGPVPLAADSLTQAQAWQFELRMERPELRGQSADSALMLRSAVLPMTSTQPPS